jgi:hypothetical protein
VWAPLAASVTIMQRPKVDESVQRRAFVALAMLSPLAIWIGLRLVFFGGIGGTYATAEYVPVSDFLGLIWRKLTHMQYLFINHKVHHEGSEDRGMLVLALDRAAKLFVYAFLGLWALRIVPEAANRISHFMHRTRAPAVNGEFLVAMWGVAALVFHFAIPLPDERYATSVVVFAWPALVAEVQRRGNTIIWLSLAMCFVVSLTRSSQRLVEWIAPSQALSRACPTFDASVALRDTDYKSMDAALRRVPPWIQQIYVLSAGGLQRTNPDYVRVALGLSAQIVRVIEIDSNCGEANELVDFDHHIADGVVSLTVTLPPCATFFFEANRFDHFAHGRLYRSDTMSYELPDAYPVKQTKWWERAFVLGRRMTVHIRPNGPARFIIEHGASKGLAWFDTP